MEQLKQNISVYKTKLPEDIINLIDQIHLEVMNPAP